MLRFAPEMLHRIARAISGAAGSDPLEADLVADHLIEANLTGHDSHGVGMLPDYVESVRQGRLVPNRHAQLASDRGAILVVDGERGYGQVIGHEAMQLGMARAQEQGIALVALRNTYHLGRIGHWAEQCARGGFASIHFVNGIQLAPRQASHGAIEARLSTNPFCVGVPGEDGPAVLLDMATSKIAMGKARVFHNQNRPAPAESFIEPSGQLTDDPGVMFREPTAALVAMGEHKGSGLAVICELLAGALGGGGTLQPANSRDGGIVNGMLSIVINPDGLVDRHFLHSETMAMTDWLRSAQPRPGFDRVLLPGEPERLRRGERLVNGIEIDPVSWAQIGEAALAAGLSDGDWDGLTA